MQDFIAQVRDPRARVTLERAIEGRGAFRRFKDTLFDFPELLEAWFKFHDARMLRQALEWLADRGLVDREAASPRPSRERTTLVSTLRRRRCSSWARPVRSTPA